MRIILQQLVWTYLPPLVNLIEMSNNENEQIQMQLKCEKILSTSIIWHWYWYIDEHIIQSGVQVMQSDHPEVVQNEIDKFGEE